MHRASTPATETGDRTTAMAKVDNNMDDHANDVKDKIKVKVKVKASEDAPSPKDAPNLADPRTRTGELLQLRRTLPRS